MYSTRDPQKVENNRQESEEGKKAGEGREETEKVKLS
jgi:hypothetical protein